MSLVAKHRSLAPAAAMTGGALMAAAGALQATGLDWNENAVRTTAQHVSLGLFSGSLVLLAIAAVALSRYAGPRGRFAAYAIASAQVVIAVASTISNIRGIDAAWFDPIAAVSNAAWLAGSIALAVSLYRARRLPPFFSVGVALVYIATIPLSMFGSGIVAGAYWMAVGRFVLAEGDLVAGVAERSPAAA